MVESVDSSSFEDLYYDRNPKPGGVATPMETTPEGSAAPTVTVATRVKQYLAVRALLEAKEAAHEKDIKDLVELKAMLTGALQAELTKNGADSIKTPAGTVHYTRRRTASVADADAFMSFVKSSGKFELLETRANPTACHDYVKEHGAQPPGVNLNTIVNVGVRVPT